MLREPCTAALTTAAEQHRLLLEVPHDDVGIGAGLAGRDVPAGARHGQARDVVVVPAEERLLVRVVLVAADDAAAGGVDQILAVRVRNERAGDMAAVADGVLQLERRALRRGAALLPALRHA